MMHLPDHKKSVTICAFVQTPYWHWMDRQADGTAKTILCSASTARLLTCDKNTGHTN